MCASLSNNLLKHSLDPRIREDYWGPAYHGDDASWRVQY